VSQGLLKAAGSRFEITTWLVVMTREFPDELLSAFLDDELSPAERAQVEQHLAASAADRQLLAELRSLRSDVASLPSVAVSPDFADRVVRAAVAEAQKYSGATATVSLAPTARRFARRWMIGTAVASAAALAASLLLVAGPWRHAASPSPAIPVVIDPVIPGNAAPQVAAISNLFLNSLRDVVPAEGEAVVLRLRVGKDLPLAAALDAALGKAGITSLAADVSTGAAQWQEAYRRNLEAKYGVDGGTPSETLLNSTVAAAEAVFIEAPLEQLESAFNALATGAKQPLELNAVGKLALAGGPTHRNPGPEGEPGSREPTAQNQPFAQRLNASLFRLEKKLAEAAATVAPPQPAGKPPKPQQPVRVLILIEAE